jgi:predicted ABC-type ATPase
MFAGPNGSGKSTIFNQIGEKVDFGVYLNADNIEAELNISNKIKLTDFVDIDVSNEFLQKYIKDHSILQKANDSGLSISLVIENSIISSNNPTPNSYETSLLVDFIRHILLLNMKKITFETVMSHKSKVELLEKTKELGYKNYLYYISTDDVDLNISRVKERVKEGGHDVPEDKISKRYFNSLKLLHEAVKYTYRTYIFDNSGDEANLILEIFNNEIIIHSNYIPDWVDRWLLSYYTLDN